MLYFKQVVFINSCNWLRTTFSKTLDKYGRLETGLKFLRVLQWSPCFLRMRTTMACLTWTGTVPDIEDSLITWVIRETRSSIQCFTRLVRKWVGDTAFCGHILDQFGYFIFRNDRKMIRNKILIKQMMVVHTGENQVPPSTSYFFSEELTQLLWQFIRGDISW